MKNTDGELPKQTGTSKAVVGAGTGLGVGFLSEANGVYTACPSEGGHSGFAPFDEFSTELTAWMTKKLGITPGTEPIVSKNNSDGDNGMVTGTVLDLATNNRG